MKLMKILIAAIVMAAMVTPAIAEDRLSLSGSMQVRGFYYDYDIEGEEDSGAWNDQRLRIGGKLSVADGVSVNFRFDVTESDENSSDAVSWGGSSSANPGGSAYQYSQRRGDVQFDKAYLQVEKNGFTLMAGQLYFGGYGLTRAMMDVVGAGFIVKYDAFTISHLKRMDENQGKNTFDGNYDGDVSLTVAKYDYKGEGLTLTPMIGYNADTSASDRDLLGLGLAGSVDLGPVLLKGEFNHFDGEALNGTVDLKGTQLYLDASMAATDNVRVGLMGWYAKGQDGGDVQVTDMNQDNAVDWAFADYHPESYGYWSGDFVAEFDIYDPAGLSTGSIAAQLYADVKASDTTSMKFAAMYYTNEDDDLVDVDGYTLNAGVAYKLAANTTLTAHLNYLDEEVEVLGVSVDGDILQIISGLVVNF